MTKIALKDIKKGTYFTLKPIEEPKDSQVYVKGDYDRSEKKFECQKFTDIWGNGRFIKGTTEVYIDFTF